MRKIITIAGIIGSGKTTLFNKLSQELDKDKYVFLDEYIPKDMPNFYIDVLRDNKPRIAYEMQMRLLYYRFNQLFYALQDSNKDIILDGGLWLDQIYAKALHRLGYISQAEINAYIALHTQMANLLYMQGDQYVIYLTQDIGNCFYNITVRKRKSEDIIPNRYLIFLQDELQLTMKHDININCNWIKDGVLEGDFKF